MVCRQLQTNGKRGSKSDRRFAHELRQSSDGLNMVLRVFSSYVQAVRRRGFWAATATYIDRVEERMREKSLGIRTSEWHTTIDPENSERRGYGPVGYRDFRLLRKYFVVDHQSAFIDYGAGLGRVVILAAQMPFARVVGVELSPDLVARGNENIDKVSAKLRAPVSLVCADATAFEVPADAKVLFFNNPFAGSILASVLENIRRSYLAAPRTIQLVCSLPPDSQFERDISAVRWLSVTHRIALTNQRIGQIFTPR
jgi:SAM-dependent methyltransferase